MKITPNPSIQCGRAVSGDPSGWLRAPGPPLISDVRHVNEMEIVNAW